MRGISFLRVMSVAGILAVSGGTGLVHAQDPLAAGLPGAGQVSLFNAEAQAPEIASVPALSNLSKNGAKLYYLGERSGMHGWFIMQDQQIQMLYLSPDRKTVLVGAMFSVDGQNVTTPQIAALAQSNKDVNTLLNSAGTEQREIAQAGQEGGATSVSGAKEFSQKMAGSVPGVPLSPGERLMQDLKASAQVIAGKNDGAELFMVVTPHCPNCKKTWEELRDSIKGGKVRVHLVPVYNSAGTEEKNMSAMLLRTQDPYATWDSFVSGNTAVLSGVPDESAVRAVQANLMLVAKWNIQGYPYLVYRGQDGRIKIVQGKPERMAAVLADLKR